MQLLNAMDPLQMRFISVIWKERFFTIFPWDSNVFHVIIYVFGNKVVVIADHKVVTIIFWPVFISFWASEIW